MISAQAPHHHTMAATPSDPWLPVVVTVTNLSLQHIGGNTAPYPNQPPPGPKQVCHWIGWYWHIGSPHWVTTLDNHIGNPLCDSTLGPTLRHHQNYNVFTYQARFLLLWFATKLNRKFTQINKVNNNFFLNSIYLAYFVLPQVRNFVHPGDCRWSDRPKMLMDWFKSL